MPNERISIQNVKQCLSQFSLQQIFILQINFHFKQKFNQRKITLNFMTCVTFITKLEVLGKGEWSI